MKTYYYEKTTDDVVNSAQQDFSLPDDYAIFPTSLSGRIWNKIVRALACGFGFIYSRLFLHTHIVGKDKLKKLLIRDISFMAITRSQWVMFLRL